MFRSILCLLECWAGEGQTVRVGSHACAGPARHRTELSHSRAQCNNNVIHLKYARFHCSLACFDRSYVYSNAGQVKDRLYEWGAMPVLGQPDIGPSSLTHARNATT